MDVGIQMVLATYGWQGMSDDEAWDEEIRLARLADELGFDALWAVEHHFNDYSFCPDNLQLMAYLAALCPNIDLGTAAVILPWNDPLRVAEKAIVLDMLSKGRLRFGIGRGLARREFAAFRQTMEESRDRFDESAAMILEALRTGWMEGDGKYYKQPRIELRPRPKYSFDGRIYAVAASGRGVRAARGADGDVRRSSVAAADAGDQPPPRAHPPVSRPRGIAYADRGFLRMLARPRRGRRPRAPAYGFVRAEQCRALRADERPLFDREGLRRLRAEIRDRPQDRARRDDRGLYEGRGVGLARPHPAHARGATRRGRRIRARHLVPFWRHPVPGRREIDAALRQGGPAGNTVLADPGRAGGRRAGSGRITE